MGKKAQHLIDPEAVKNKVGEWIDYRPHPWVCKICDFENDDGQDECEGEVWVGDEDSGDYVPCDGISPAKFEAIQAAWEKSLKTPFLSLDLNKPVAKKAKKS